MQAITTHAFEFTTTLSRPDAPMSIPDDEGGDWAFVSASLSQSDIPHEDGKHERGALVVLAVWARPRKHGAVKVTGDGDRWLKGGKR